MLHQIFVLALVAVAACSAGSVDIKSKQCPMTLGKYPFDAEKFAGEWHLAAGCSSTHEKKGKCGKYNVVYQKDNKDVFLASRYTGVNPKDNTPIAYDALTTPIYTDKVGLGYAVIRPQGANKYSPVFKQSIVATDYNTYAVYLACRPTFDDDTRSFGRQLYAEIWTRQGVTLSKDTLDALRNVLASYDVDQSDIKVIERNC